MPSKRLNIMLYSALSGEQIILPINPVSIKIKYEKLYNTYGVLGFGNVNVMGEREPLKITLSHFLPEDDSIFSTNSNIMYDKTGNLDFVQYDYSSRKAVEILKKWAYDQIKIRLVIDEEINVEGFIASFEETIRESTSSKPYNLEFLEYNNPTGKIRTSLGLIKRANTLYIPTTMLMKAKDTVYSVASKYSLDFKTLAANNNVTDANASIIGKRLFLKGV